MFTIVTNPDIFYDDYLPVRIVSREPQIQEIRFSLQPLLKGKKPSPLWIHGKPGSGKTSTAKFILKELEEVGVKGIYLNCWEFNSFYSVIDRITEGLLTRKSSRNSHYKFHVFENHVRKKPVVLVLDEADKNNDMAKLIYQFSDLRIGLVYISCSLHTLYSLETRSESRFNGNFIEFKPYNTQDLIEILKERASSGLHPRTWTLKLLEKIARLSKGDARIAIQTLKNAGDRADREGATRINPNHAKLGFSRAKSLRKTYRLKELTDHHRMIYELVKKNPNIISGELWGRYSRYKKPVARRTFTLYLTQLTNLGLIRSEGAAGRSRTFRV